MARAIAAAPAALRQVWVLLWKDLLIDLRRKENLLAMFLFAVLTLLIFQFAVGGDEARRYRVTPRVLALLEQEGLSRPALEALRGLSGRAYLSRGALLEALDALRAEPLPPPARIALLKFSARSLLQESAAGLLWVTVLLAGVLGLSRSITTEREGGCMDGLLLTPVSRGVIYLGKMLSNTLFLAVMLALLLPLVSLFFAVDLRDTWLPLMLVMLGGGVGIYRVGDAAGRHDGQREGTRGAPAHLAVSAAGADRGDGGASYRGYSGRRESSRPVALAAAIGCVRCDLPDCILPGVRVCDGKLNLPHPYAQGLQCNCEALNCSGNVRRWEVRRSGPCRSPWWSRPF